VVAVDYAALKKSQRRQMKRKKRTAFIAALGLYAALASPVSIVAQNPVPFINSISPVSASPSGTDFTLTVNGAGFVQGATVNWTKGASQTPLVTSFVSSTRLTATVPASLTAKPGTASIVAINPGGGVASNALLFPVTTPSTSISMGGADIELGPTPISSVVGDFNGDGRPDLAELVNGSIAILLGNGDGTFNTSFINTPFGTMGGGVVWRSIVTGDFNGDGRTDLAVLRWNFAGDATCPSGGIVSILLGNGDGTFSVLPAPACVGTNPLSMVAADFNGDGKLDLAVANNCGFGPQGRCPSPGTVSILLGNGDGTFTDASTLVAGPSNAEPQAITAGDFNGDGIVDLAISNCLGGCPFGQVTILLGNGDGSFTPTPTSPGTGSVPFSIAAADLNGDGILDLIVANECGDGNKCVSGSITVLLGNGDGTFTALPALVLDSRPQGLAVGDFNGDGKLDVIAGGAFIVDAFNGAATFLLGNGDGTFKISSQSLSPGFVNALSPADFDGDGKLDLALAAYPSHATVLLRSLGVTLSATRLIFGPRPIGTTSAVQSVTLSNTGNRPESIGAITAITGDGSTPLVAFSQTNNCASALAPGASCTINVSFKPPQAGVLPGNLSIAISGGERTVSLTGVGGPGVFLSPTSLLFPITQDTTGSTAQSLLLTNISPLPAPLTSLAIAGSFSQTNDCAGAVPPLGSCDIFVTFSPSVSGPVAGSLTATVQDGVFNASLVATLSGTGSAVKLSPFPGTFFDFGTEYLGAASDPASVTLTNLSTLPLRLNRISASGSSFVEKDHCPGLLRAGESCTISTTFHPTLDSGPAEGTLLIDANDPISPLTFPLLGTGIGISHNVVMLHYDYMVAADHTHDPEVVAPGAIQAVVDAFARHGIRAIIDPRHTAIPETDVTVFGPADCSRFLSGFHFVNFYDLKAQYFHSTSPRVHYSIFAHYIAIGDPESPFKCNPFSFSGDSELPGQNFVNGLYFITPEDGYTPSLARLALAGAYMHEFGHNLGLHHGGGIGPLGSDGDDFQRNFKPNYISVMNYNYLFFGIPEADAVGSTNLKSCSVDSDCGNDALCTDTALAAPFPAKACFRLDYSRQLLPAGGNTPGALDENGNLDETAGLGSGNTDITFFTDAKCNYQVVPSNGPLDFDGDGSATNAHATADLIPGWWEFLRVAPGCPSGIHMKLGGFDDWAALTDKVDDIETQNSLNASTPGDLAREVDLPTLKGKHLLYPPRQVAIAIHPGCALASAPLAPGQPGTVTVAILGSSSLDVTQIDPSSLRLHGVEPLNTSVIDVNADGQLDLVATFDTSQLHLPPQAVTIRMTGWMTNSQRFWATAPVTIVNDSSALPAMCKN
jgi:hypothetical protein